MPPLHPTSSATTAKVGSMKRAHISQQLFTTDSKSDHGWICVVCNADAEDLLSNMIVLLLGLWNKSLVNLKKRQS